MLPVGDRPLRSRRWFVQQPEAGEDLSRWFLRPRGDQTRCPTMSLSARYPLHGLGRTVSRQELRDDDAPPSAKHEISTHHQIHRVIGALDEDIGFKRFDELDRCVFAKYH